MVDSSELQIAIDNAKIDYEKIGLKPFREHYGLCKKVYKNYPSLYQDFINNNKASFLNYQFKLIRLIIVLNFKLNALVFLKNL